MPSSVTMKHLLPFVYILILTLIDSTALTWLSSSDISGGYRYSRHCRRHASHCSQPSSWSKLSESPSAESNEVDKLKEQAESLRREIEAFERNKQRTESDERRKKEQEQAEQVALRDRYSAIVPILKPDGTVFLEKCEFPPRYKDEASFITVCEASLPLGILLGEAEGSLAGLTLVDEVAIGSNGEKAGIREGDIVRAFTACKMGMDMPTWQVIAGGIGVPKTRRFMYSVDRRPFEEVMEAISSNRMDPEMRPVLMVVERRE